MIITVTVNPCLDEEKHFDTKELVRGTNRATETEKYPGGKGIDVSRAIHAAGSRSVATGFIGGHIGKLVRGLLAIEGIDCDFVEIRGETRTNVICHLKGGGEVRLNSDGPRISGDEYHELLSKLKDAPDVEAALVSGSVCPGMEAIHSYCQILAAFKERNRACQTFLDTGGKHTMGALGGKFPPDFIKPNIYEFHRLLRVNVNVDGLAFGSVDAGSLKEETLIDEYCRLHGKLPEAWTRLVERLRDFRRRHPDVCVLLSISKLGALVLDGDSLIHAFYSAPVKLHTTVGAGDSFLGGFVTSYVEDEPRNLHAALRAGVAASTARLQGQHRDFGYIDQEKLQQVLASKDLHVETFKVHEAAEYVENRLRPCFSSGARSKPVAVATP